MKDNLILKLMKGKDMVKYLNLKYLSSYLANNMLIYIRNIERIKRTIQYWRKRKLIMMLVILPKLQLNLSFHKDILY